MKPILFNTEMIRAILDGRKSVTRRLVKPQPLGAHTVMDHDLKNHTFEIMCGNGGEGGVFRDWSETVKAPYWIGDILYVRETWAAWSRTTGTPPVLYYKADENAPDGIKWRPSIHMPKEAARIFLCVTDVRVERLQDITADEAEKEGCNTFGNHDNVLWNPAIMQFEKVWNSTIPKHPNKFKRYPFYWEDNPWVWVIKFERISKEEAYDN